MSHVIIINKEYRHRCRTGVCLDTRRSKQCGAVTLKTRFQDACSELFASWPPAVVTSSYIHADILGFLVFSATAVFFLFLSE